MADVSISSLPLSAVLDGTEEVAIVQSSSTVKTTTKAISDLKVMADPVPDSVAVDVATLVTDYNTLLASLRAANVIGS